jgi:hypothetical protein
MDSPDEPWLRGIVVERAAQLGHERGQIHVGDEGLGPESVEQLLPRHEVGPAVQQQVQQIESLRRQVNDTPLFQQLACADLEREFTKLKARCVQSGSFSSVAATARAWGADPAPAERIGSRKFDVFRFAVWSRSATARSAENSSIGSGRAP